MRVKAGTRSTPRRGYRATVSLCLALAWLTLAGFDLLEDLRAHQQLKIHASAATQAREVERFRSLLNNVVESASAAGYRASVVPEPLQSERSRDVPAPYSNGFRLHKLHRVFLI
ncbi:MAG TPA: hypothetical protein VNO43_06715 [Candidatus Eisenbacteria bacterium]|nr:hypothetical protein [Candidatus Eisenbacteria bacterium]